MPEIAALVVGIGAYAYPQTDLFPPLAFAAADADGVEAYLKACWPVGGEALIVRIDETAATADRIGAGFAELARAGPIEMLLVYLSGHGLVNGEHTGFLCQPLTPGGDLDLLTPHALDTLLLATPAKRTVVILDCCFAAGIVRRMEYFAGLGTDIARLYVASSREDQRTWEDTAAGHGVFTAHLLDLLNTGSSAKLGAVRKSLDVDGELFPVICDQVPLYVFSAKAQAQEPVKGGVSMAPVTLPVARAARRLREQTALGTAVRRVRQIGVGVAASIAGLLLFAYTMLYYVETDPNGSLSVRRGTRWLEPAFRLLPTTRVATGISTRDLSTNPAASRPLEGGYTTGVWTHRTGGGYRSWYETVAAGLEPRAAERLNVLIGADAPSPALDEFSVPGDIAFAAWSAMVRARPSELPTILSHLPVDEEEPLLAPFNPGKLDFAVLDRSVADMELFAEALCYTATIDPVQTMPAYLRFAKAAREWLAHNTDAQRGRDARATVRSAVAQVLPVIARARQDRGMPALDPGSIAAIGILSDNGYAEIFDSAVAAIPDTSVASVVASRALDGFRGDPFDPDQERALQAAMSSLDGSAASQATVDRVYAVFEAADNSMNVYLTRFLIAAGETKSLSPEMVARLVRQARAAVARPERDFMDSELARVLAHAMRQVPAKDRAVIYRLIDLVARDVTPMSTSTAEMYAALGGHALDPPGMLAKVQAQARAAPPFSPEAPTAGAGLPGLTIVIGHGPWVGALALYGRNRKLPAQDIEVLRAQLGNPALRDLVLDALAFQNLWIARGDPTNDWVHELAAVPSDSSERDFRQGIIAIRMAALPRSEFEHVVRRLLAARDRHSEPEARIAIGAIVADATVRRVRSPRRAQSLFS